MSRLERTESRPMDKSPDAFRTISEVAEDLDLPQHVLRFWETRFAQIKPLKRGGGRRYYRPDDVDLLKGIRHLLYDEGYTIKGVQRIFKGDGVRFVQAIGRGEESVEAPVAARAFQGEELAHSEPERTIGTASGILSSTPVEGRPTGTEREPILLPESVVQAGLPPRDASLLRGALDELLECERVLATLKAQTRSDLDQQS